MKDNKLEDNYSILLNLNERMIELNKIKEKYIDNPLLSEDIN